MLFAMLPADAVQIAWCGPWQPFADNDCARHAETELQRELCPGHVLVGCPARALGQRIDCDDALFLVAHPRARYAVVHFTYQRESNPVWPATELFATLEEFRQFRLLPDALDYAT